MKRRTLKAFTLIELMIVIAIIAILGMIIVPNTLHYIRTSKVNRNNTQAQEIYNATTDYLIRLQRRGYTPEQVAEAFYPGGAPGSTHVLVGYSAGIDKQGNDPWFIGHGNGSSYSCGSPSIEPDAIKGIERLLAGSTGQADSDNWWTEGNCAWAVAVNTTNYSVVAAWYVDAADAPWSLSSQGSIFASVADPYESFSDQMDIVEGHSTHNSYGKYVGQFPPPANT